MDTQGHPKLEHGGFQVCVDGLGARLGEPQTVNTDHKYIRKCHNKFQQLQHENTPDQVQDTYSDLDRKCARRKRNIRT